MNFEERLAQTQAKLDELKAKINDSIDSAKEAYKADKKEAMISVAKMNAAIEDFGRDVEAQVYCDVTSMKEEAKADADAMNDALDEIDSKVTAKAEKIDKALDEVDDKIDAKLDEVDAKIDAKLDADAEKCDAAMEKIDAKINDDLDTIEGDYYAAGEDLRLAKERYDSKLNATRLKVQMHLEEVKNRIEAKKTELDKAAQEELIMDLLDYADDCQMIAYAYAMEAELAIIDACDQIEDYEAKYGDIEKA